MRVVAGKYRARKLKEFDLNTTRPTLDRVKEAMFSAIQFDLMGAVVLDLFAGTGALGIEAISRGSKKVYFVDDNSEAIRIVKKNLEGICEDHEVVKTNYMTFLNNTKEKFDVMLLDPPFKSGYGEIALKYIFEHDMLNDNGVVVYEKAKDDEALLNFANVSVKRKVYGSVEVCFLRKRLSEGKNGEN